MFLLTEHPVYSSITKYYYLILAFDKRFCNSASRGLNVVGTTAVAVWHGWIAGVLHMTCARGVAKLRC